MTLMNSSVSFDRAARAVTSASGDSSFHLSKTPPRQPRKRHTVRQKAGGCMVGPNADDAARPDYDGRRAYRHAASLGRIVKRALHVL